MVGDIKHQSWCTNLKKEIKQNWANILLRTRFFTLYYKTLNIERCWHSSSKCDACHEKCTEVGLLCSGNTQSNPLLPIETSPVEEVANGKRGKTIGSGTSNETSIICNKALIVYCANSQKEKRNGMLEDVILGIYPVRYTYNSRIQIVIAITDRANP